jgi:peptidyl-prolyl cis-trans isomerase SurA
MRTAELLRYAICLLFCLAIAGSAGAQTLITYGDHQISRDEFLKAYRKNNLHTQPGEKAYRDYLELYIRYKLKVRAALDHRLDRLPNQLSELQNFRNQIIAGYLNDEPSLTRLVNEAFLRSQKDIHIAHIFISSPQGANPADSLKAQTKLRAVSAGLKKGADFGELASEYSDDPFARSNRGNIGFITVFTLPYSLENLAYGIQPGHVSGVYRSRSGYHIFKNLEERKALGRIRTAQILLAFPPNAGDSVKQEVSVRADSMYEALSKGANFGELARLFSGDNLSYQTGGEMPEFGVGKYEPGFESAAFALTRDGEISHPVPDAFGYHILKRLSRRMVSAERSKASLDAVKIQVASDPRIELSRKAMLDKIMRVATFKRYPVNADNLRIYTDYTLQNKPLPKFQELGDSTVLFSLADKKIRLKEWLDYRKSIRNVPSLNNGKTDKEIMDQYIENAAFEFYRNHAEDYDKDFAYQLNEFREGNLLFEVMQHQVWDKASSDSAGLLSYYQSHKDKYWWEPSADAIVFICGSEHSADQLKSRLEHDPGEWKKFVDSSNGSVHADSGRFELAQLPMTDRSGLQPGRFTYSVKNPADNTVTLAYILQLYPDRTPRNYKDARGFVINDYQTFLEDHWVTELKKEYPVRVNESVFRTLPR